MSLWNGEELSELECYDKIIQFFSNQERDREKTEAWKHRALLKLMESLEKRKNRRLIMNALIILISLFENLPPDIFNNRGVNINLLNKRDKEPLLSALKQEFSIN